MKKWAVLILAVLVFPAASTAAAEANASLVAGTVTAVRCAEHCEVELQGERSALRVACLEPGVVAACRSLQPGDTPLIAVRAESSVLQATHVGILLHSLAAKGSAEATLARFANLKLAVDGVAFRGDLRIQFQEVVEDSRCPEDVVCVWSGRAVIGLALWHGDAFLGNYELIQGQGEDPALAEVEVAGYAVRLIGVLPVPRSDTGPIDPASYRIVLRVTDPL